MRSILFVLRVPFLFLRVVLLVHVDEVDERPAGEQEHGAQVKEHVPVDVAVHHTVKDTSLPRLERPDRQLVDPNIWEGSDGVGRRYYAGQDQGLAQQGPQQHQYLQQAFCWSGY